MQNVFLHVLDNFARTRASLSGVAKVTNAPDHVAILDELPKRIESYLVKSHPLDRYKVKGSIGKGNIARVPWVGVFNNGITESAENGYYIVLLFAEDMSSCYLSLNQGITAVERLYTKRFAWRKMHEAAVKAAREIERHALSVVGRIDLKATGDLARGYEFAAIESFHYSRDDLPNESTFFEHFDHLLKNYETLIKKFGKDLYNLIEISEGEFQQVVRDKAALQEVETEIYEPEGGVVATYATKLGSKGFVRSPTVAARALKAAKFQCEIDSSHWTFTSRAMQQKYVEAHHLIPINQQTKFTYSLDVVANVVSLCATCHRMLHYGLPRERKGLLRALFKARKEDLSAKSIKVRDQDFLRFYGKDFLLED